MNKYTAEFVGTFWLVLGGCGSAVLAAAFPDVGIGLLGVSLAFGLTVLPALAGLRLASSMRSAFALSMSAGVISACLGYYVAFAL